MNDFSLKFILSTKNQIMKSFKYTLIIISYMLMLINTTFPQNITITDDDSYTPDNSAILDIKSTPEFDT